MHQPELIRTFADCREPELLPMHLVASCNSTAEALLLAVRMAKVKRTDSALAGRLGYSRSHWSEILKGKAVDSEGNPKKPKFFDMDKADDFARLVGNYGLQQWIALRIGKQLVRRQETQEERMARLEAENAELRAKAA